MKEECITLSNYSKKNEYKDEKSNPPERSDNNSREKDFLFKKKKNHTKTVHGEIYGCFFITIKT